MMALAAQVPACSECALTGISALETWGQSQAGETIPHQSLILSHIWMVPGAPSFNPKLCSWETNMQIPQWDGCGSGAAFHSISQVRKLRPTALAGEEIGQGSAKAQDGSQVQGFLWGLGLVGLPRDHPCPAASLPCSFPSETPRPWARLGMCWGEAAPSRPCVSVLLFARRGVNEVMDLLRHSIRLGLTALLRARGCSV